MVLLSASPASSQDFKLSQYANVSLLYCEPGSELYTSFGHSAIRINDPLLDLDLIYNYGIFDFYAPGFYTNFVNGRLTYSLGRQYFSDFIFEYEIQERGVVEQVLNLNSNEKNVLLNFLEKNYLPENRDYSYDFLFDNCATKIRDILEYKVLFPRIVVMNNHLSIDKTFRSLISESLSANTWSLFGINLVLASPIDKKIQSRDAQFLPKYLYKQMKNYSVDGSPIVTSETQIIPSKVNKKTKQELYKTPAFWSVLFFTITLILSLFNLFGGELKLVAFDNTIFLITGILSLLIGYLWLISEHQTMNQNYNLLWASPLSFAFLWHSLKKQHKTTPKLATLYFLCLLATPIIHLIGLQKLDLLFFPIIAALAIRTLPLLSKK